MTEPIAFALGGLGGNNFHGAGLLQAALVKERTPVAISCTSGQIYWVYEYLRARQAGTTLRPIIERELAKIEPTRWPDKNFWNLFLPIFGGKPQEKFRPAFPEWFMNYGVNLTHMLSELPSQTIAAIRELMQHQNQIHVFYLKQLLNTFPAQLLIPRLVLNQSVLSEISRQLDNSDICIIFNSYDPIAGCEHIYLNLAAMAALGKARGDRSSYRSYQGSAGSAQSYCGEGVTRLYERIDADAVQAGLWLYEYGFDASGSFLDGAYIRGIILSELSKLAQKIYVARPINHKWLGSLPETFIERCDLQTEVFFNGSYFGELDRIMLINELIRNEFIRPHPESPFKRVDVIPIEIRTQMGFFDYIFEDIDVFEDSFNESWPQL